MSTDFKTGGVDGIETTKSISTLLEKILETCKETNSINSLTTKNFQHKAGSVGELVTDLDDIEQCYQTIFYVTKGDIPFNPNIGTDLMPAMGETPEDSSGIVSKVLKEEFTKQETRGEVLSLKTLNSNVSNLSVDVKFEGKLTKEIQEIVIERI